MTMEARSETVEEGVFDPAEFSDELMIARSNKQLGTSMWFENDRVRVWEVLLDPGERGAFHSHTTNYFWTVIEGSKGLQRFSNGRFVVRNYVVGETKFLEHSEEDYMIHDLENVGDSRLRFTTVELLD
jgi:beta-alanine degradation protein BauB